MKKAISIVSIITIVGCAIGIFLGVILLNIYTAENAVELGATYVYDGVSYSDLSDTDVVDAYNLELKIKFASMIVECAIGLIVSVIVFSLFKKSSKTTIVILGVILLIVGMIPLGILLIIYYVKYNEINNINTIESNEAAIDSKRVNVVYDDENVESKDSNDQENKENE